MQRATIHLFSMQNALSTSSTFALNQKVSLWTVLAVNAPHGPSIREIGIAWPAVFSKASAVMYAIHRRLGITASALIAGSFT